MMAVPVGGFLSFAVGGPVAQAYGWRAALLVAAAPALLLVPALLFVKEPGRGAADATDAPARSLAGIGAFWWIAASGAVVNFLLYSFSFFLPAFLTRVHGLSIAEAGLATGVGSGVAGIAGALAAGRLGDRFSGSLARGRLRTAALTAAAAAPVAWMAIGLPGGSAFAAVPLLMIAYGLWQMYYGLVYAAIQDLVPAGLRATAMAAYYVATYLCGAAFGPLVTGRLSDHFAREAAAAGLAAEAARASGLHSAMYAIPALSAVLAVVLCAAARSATDRNEDPVLP
jgi:MFS family permease